MVQIMEELRHFTGPAQHSQQGLQSSKFVVAGLARESWEVLS